MKLGLPFLNRKAPSPTVAPRRRPTPDEQCIDVAASTGRQCTNFAKDDGRCKTHARSARRTPAALTASVSVVQLDGAGWQSWKFGSRAWQIEAWRLYDITGPLRFVANWVGNSVSRCRLFVAEVNESGEPGDEAVDPDIAQLAGGLMGQGPAKDEALRLLGINLFVAGEAYIIAEADALEGGGDRWFIVSGRHISRSGNNVTIRRSQLDGGGEMHYREGVDLIIRVWTPHPNDTDEPDSSTRSAIPELRKIEAIGKREFAELDSRLAGAGLLLLPAGIDFPKSADEPPGIEGFELRLQRTMATSLQDRSSAEAMVPIAMTVAPDLVDKIKHLTFWSDLSEHLIPLAEAAYRALGMSLDIPPEILLGQADSNHWCVDDQTEILTEDGWRSHAQLKAGDTVLTLNHETGLSEWQAVEDVKRWDVTDLDMVAMESAGHSSLTTPSHRWPVLSGDAPEPIRRFTTSAELEPGDCIVTESLDEIGMDAADVTWQRYSGTIWCPVTPNQTWLARRNGTTYYTGNTAWQTSDDAITTQIKPLLARISDAATTGYLRGALDELGKDPQGFVFHFDAAALTTKPNRTADAITYYGEGLISGSATVREGAFTEEDRPDEAETKRRFAERAVQGAPTLIQDPALREILGLPALPTGFDPSAPPPASPAPQPAPVKEPESPPEQPEQPPQPEETAALVPVANLAMRRALALAGGRLVPHRQRDRYEGTERHQLHTRFGAVSNAKAEEVLRGAWADLTAVAEDLHVDPTQLRKLLHEFSVELLTRGIAYDRALLTELIGAAVRGQRLKAMAEVSA